MKISLLYVDVDKRCQWVGLLMNHNNNRSLLGFYIDHYHDDTWSTGVWVLYKFFGYDSRWGRQYE